MTRIGYATVLFLALHLFGCPSGSGDTGPVEECTRAGEQCKMGGGQLGVCTTDMDSDPPALFCMSQH